MSFGLARAENPNGTAEEINMLEITINGQTHRLERELTVAELIFELRLVPQQVAVEVNRTLVPRAEHREHRLRCGDELEIVSLAGGG